MGHLFISYRREDSAGHAGRLEEALEASFGPGSVFRDVDDLVPGLSFSAALDARLDEARVVLVLIGSRWLDAELDGLRRLDQAEDYVRLEVSRALDSGKPVIPVLLGDTPMPARDQLPEPLKTLADRHAVRLHDAGWKDDVTRLVETLGQWMPSSTKPSVQMARRAALAVLVLLGLFIFAWPARTPFPSGSWEATVRYDWGPVVDERFVLTERGEEVVGWASFFGVPRPIAEAHWADGVLKFETRTESQMGDESRVLRHRYLMQRDETDRHWQIDYVIDGGFTPVKPMHFELKPGADAS